MAKKTKAQELASKFINEFKKMSNSDLLSSLNIFKNAFAARERVLEQSGQASPALKNIKEKNPYRGSITDLEKQYKNKGQELRNLALNEIAKYKRFFESKTSEPTPKKTPKQKKEPAPKVPNIPKVQKEPEPKVKSTEFSYPNKPKARKKTKAEEIASRPIEDFAKYKTTASDLAQMEKDLKTLQRGYIKRSEEMEKKGLFSIANYGMKEYTNPYLDSISELKKQYKDRPGAWRNRMLAEIAVFHNFFNNETSTVGGIYKVNKEQDARIFGTNKNGMPLGTLTKDERETYWKLYNEYMRLNENRIAQSNDVQKALGFLAQHPNYIADVNGKPTELGIELPKWDDMENIGYDLVGAMARIEMEMKRRDLIEIEEEEKRFGTGNQVHSGHWHNNSR